MSQRQQQCHFQAMGFSQKLVRKVSRRCSYHALGDDGGALDEEEEAVKVSPATMKADKLSAPAGYVITRPLFFFNFGDLRPVEKGAQRGVEGRGWKP
mmetsp:Transcript_18814/g.46704  ORF Transcript_18814/g.46704 Transcript_18814/m.46704 type:complete len:97 (-) Transcript_18814:97-387(-)